MSEELQIVGAGPPKVQRVTIDGGGASDGAIVDGASSSIKASVLDYANSNPLAVRLTDTSGDYVGAGAGTQYTEDAAAAANPVGTALNLIRQDTLAGLTTADGDNVAARGTDKGELYVKHADAIPVTDNGGNISIDDGGNSITVDGAVSVTGTVASEDPDSGNPVKVGAKYNNALPTFIDGDRADLQVDSRGILRVALHSGGSSVAIGSVADNADDIAVSATASKLLTASRLYVFDGTTYDRMRGDSTDGVLVNLGSNNDVSLNAGTNAIGKLAANSGVDIGDVDITSVIPGTGATNLGKAVDSVAGATDTGVALLAVRDDALATLTPADGDYTHLRVSSTGALHVTGGGGGTEYTVDEAAPAAPTGATFVMERDDALSALTEIEGDWTNPRANANGALWTTIDGTVTVGSHAVTNAGTFAVQESGSALTALQLIDDIVYTDDTSTHATGTSKGALMMAAATPTDGSVNANDIGAVAMTTDRKLHVSVQDALPAGTNAIGKLAANSGVDIGDVDVTSIIPGTGATNLGKAEDAAHSSTDTGVMDLGVRVDTPNATVAANGDYHYKATDLVGGIRTALYETDFAVLGTNHVKKYYTNAGAVTDGIVWSPAAGKRWYVTDLIVNTSAAATVTFEDDKAGGDEAVMKFELAANSGISHNFTTPWFSGEDAADLMVTTSAGNIYITVTGYEI